MKYPCNLIQDLLPLYYDGVCSHESSEAVENHLLECSACKKYYEEMCAADEVASLPHNEERERQKAALFQSVRRKLKKWQIAVSMLCVVAFILIVFVGIKLLENSTKMVLPDYISASMIDGNLIAQLNGSVWDGAHSTTVVVQQDGREQTYLFFYLIDNRWDDLTTSPKAFSEYTLCPENKGADSIDYVFYYTGDYTGIDQMEYEELKEIITNSTLLWSK